MTSLYPTSVATVVRRFNAHMPIDPEAALVDCGVTLQYIDKGMFRNVYRVVGFPLVVKFAQGEKWRHCVGHAREEYATVKRLKRSKRKWAPLHPHLPKIYYFDHFVGTMLMHEYKPVTGDTDTDFVSELLRNCGIHDADDHPHNFGLDEKGNVVIIDLGIFGETSCG